MREDIMTTYRNLMAMHKSFNVLKSQSTLVDIHIVAYAKNHTKEETYLYNNRLFFGIINPSQKHKDQYTVNWNYIKSL